MPKASTIDEMAGFLVRWTKEDLQQNVPQRLKDAMKLTGAERAPLSPALLIRWLQDIEQRGPANLTSAVATVNERPEGAYGARSPATAGKLKSEVRGRKKKNEAPLPRPGFFDSNNRFGR